MNSVVKGASGPTTGKKRHYKKGHCGNTTLQTLINYHSHSPFNESKLRNTMQTTTCTHKLTLLLHSKLKCCYALRLSGQLTFDSAWIAAK